MTKRSLGPFAIAVTFVFLACMAGSRSEALARTHGSWERQAEQSFYLSPGLGHQVMTERQWHDYSRKMEHMNQHERTQYRERMHKQFIDEARQKGITLPEVSPEHGKHHQGAMSMVLAQLGALGGASSGSAAGNAIPGGSGTGTEMGRGFNATPNNPATGGFNSGTNPGATMPGGQQPGNPGVTPGAPGTAPGTLPGGGVAPGNMGTQNPGPGAMTPGGF